MKKHSTSTARRGSQHRKKSHESDDLLWKMVQEKYPDLPLQEKMLIRATLWVEVHNRYPYYSKIVHRCLHPIPKTTQHHDPTRFMQISAFKDRGQIAETILRLIDKSILRFAIAPSKRYPKEIGEITKQIMRWVVLRVNDERLVKEAMFEAHPLRSLLETVTVQGTEPDEGQRQ